MLHFLSSGNEKAISCTSENKICTCMFLYRVGLEEELHCKKTSLGMEQETVSLSFLKKLLAILKGNYSKTVLKYIPNNTTIRFHAVS